MIALYLSCAADPTLARSTWIGEAVEDYRKTLPVLDGLPSYSCPGPPDDAMVFRAMDHQVDISFSIDESSGRMDAVSWGDYRSTILPYNAYSGVVRSPYDVALNLWYSSYIYEDAAVQFQGERRYDEGLEWPVDPGYANVRLEHTLSGAADRYDNETVLGPHSWDSTSWDPEKYFYPVADCVSHIRPGRFAGWFWMDPAQAGQYEDTVSNPVWVVWNAGTAYVTRRTELEFNYASTSETSGFRKGPNGFVSMFFDDLTPADVWPHLKDDWEGGG